MNKYVLLAVLVAACFAIHAEAAVCPTDAVFANCSACNSTVNTTASCTSCLSGFGLYNATANNSIYCGACSPACLNCTQAFNSSSCALSNDTTQDTSTAATPCATINTTMNGSAFYQSYVAGNATANGSVYTYACYSCPINCTNCTNSTNSTKPTANITACNTCSNGTAFANTTSYYGCFANATTSGATTSNSSNSSSTTTSTTGAAATAACLTSDSNGNCTACPVGYATSNVSNKIICAICATACLNCRVPADATQCVNSNNASLNNASSATPCGSNATQSYLAGAINAATFNYTCYACPYNCTDCTLTNGSKPISAVTQSCKTCANGTSFMSGTYNGITGTACLSSNSTSFSTIKAGLTIGAVMTVLVSLLL